MFNREFAIVEWSKMVYYKTNGLKWFIINKWSKMVYNKTNGLKWFIIKQMV
jgi:hypothetical protein